MLGSGFASLESPAAAATAVASAGPSEGTEEPASAPLGSAALAAAASGSCAGAVADISGAGAASAAVTCVCAVFSSGKDSSCEEGSALPTVGVSDSGHIPTASLPPPPRYSEDPDPTEILPSHGTSARKEMPSARKGLYRLDDTSGYAPVSIQPWLLILGQRKLRPDTARLANLAAVVGCDDLDRAAHFVEARADAHAQTVGEGIFLRGRGGERCAGRCGRA